MVFMHLRVVPTQLKAPVPPKGMPVVLPRLYTLAPRPDTGTLESTTALVAAAVPVSPPGPKFKFNTVATTARVGAPTPQRLGSFNSGLLRTTQLRVHSGWPQHTRTLNANTGIQRAPVPPETNCRPGPRTPNHRHTNIIETVTMTAPRSSQPDSDPCHFKFKLS